MAGEVMVSAETKRKLEMLFPRLASNQDGEIVSTIRAINRVIKKDGVDWHDLTAKLCSVSAGDRGGKTSEPQNKFAQKVRFCLQASGIFNQREIEFLSDINAKLRHVRELTPKQAVWLESLYGKATRSSGMG